MQTLQVLYQMPHFRDWQIKKHSWSCSAGVWLSVTWYNDSTLLIWFSDKVIFSSISGTGLSVCDYESIQLSKLRKQGSHSQSQGGIMTATSSTTKATKCWPPEWRSESSQLQVVLVGPRHPGPCPRPHSLLILTLMLAGWLCFSEINRVRVSLFHHQNKKDLCLPEPLGPVVTLQEKLFVPIKDHPDVSPCRDVAFIKVTSLLYCSCKIGGRDFFKKRINTCTKDENFTFLLTCIL